MRPSAEPADATEDNTAPPASSGSRSAADPAFAPPPPSPVRETADKSRAVAEFLRGLRVGGALLALGGIVWAAYQVSINPGMVEIAVDQMLPMLTLFALVALVAWACYAGLIGGLRARRRRVVSVTLLAILLAALPTFIAAFRFGALWRSQSRAIGMDYPGLFPLAIAAAGLAVTVTADIFVRLLRRPRPDVRLPLRRRLRPTPTALVATAVVLVLATSAVMVPALSFPSRSVWLTAVRPVSVPETLDDDVAWQRVFAADEPVRGVIAGSFTPIVVTDHGVLGLDPNSGYTDWVHTRPAETIALGDCADGPKGASCHAALSPNRAHLVIAYDAGPTRTLFVGIDTATGRVAFEHMHQYTYPPQADQRARVQITDHVVMIDQDILSLEDGSVLATAPRVRFPACAGDADCATSKPVFASFFQGGHSTLILGAHCPSDRSGWCELTLVPDDDLTAITTVGGFVPAANGSGPVVVDGWSVRYRNPDAAYQELEESGADSKTRSLEAVSLDALSGAVAGPAVALGDLTAPVDDDGTRTLRLQGPSTDVVFDPATGQVGTVQELTEQAYGFGYLDTLTASCSGDAVTEDGRDLEVLRADNTTAVRLSYADIQDSDNASSAAPRYRDDGYLVPAPGIIALVCSRSASTGGAGASAPADSGGAETVIIGLSNRPAAHMDRPA
ncbi:hypothetical protein SAMN05216355_103109 [Actinomyces ruminicola]|uniref:Uncharacterized protein n=1 Tax=Actinomyces ruminicola TaxID=332524 RepID=A0A1H0B6I1_9ACTO|nr:hypothetical protein [Actinomyces ruminicola]SDN41277.1 hypothetical protein SAMN05216355_103109 [Actinomyces ruminicola]